MRRTVLELLDLPTVLEEYLDTYDDGRPERVIARELQRRCMIPTLYLEEARAILVTPRGVRVYTRTGDAWSG